MGRASDKVGVSFLFVSVTGVHGDRKGGVAKELSHNDDGNSGITCLLMGVVAEYIYDWEG